MSAITISRQSGSEGNRIVKVLSDRLGWKYFDKHLMMQLATEHGLDPTKIEDITADQHYVRSFWEDTFSGLAIPYGATPWVLTEPYAAKEEMNLRQVGALIRAAHQHGKVIIIGRGSQVVLKGEPDVLHVRIIAPLERRIQRWMERKQVSHKVAKEIAKGRDHQHVDFVKTYFDEDINNPDLYDLIINTDKLTLDCAADVIISAAKNL